MFYTIKGIFIFYVWFDDVHNLLLLGMLTNFDDIGNFINP